MDVSTELLQTFICVSATKNFSRAAERLHKAQSSVSLQIASLERAVGLALFDRTERPIKLTEAGTLFLSYAVEQVNRAEAIEKVLRGFATGVAGEVRVAASTPVGSFLLPGIIADIRRDSPQIRIEVLAQSRGLVFESVESERVDFAIGFSDTMPWGKREQAGDLKIQLLANLPSLFAVAADHPLARAGTVSVDELCRYPMVTGTAGTGHAEVLEPMLERNGIVNYPVNLRVNSVEGVKHAVLAGLDVGLLQEFMIRRELAEGTVVEVRVRGVQLTGCIILIERKGRLLSPTARMVKERIVAAFADGAKHRNGKNRNRERAHVRKT